MPRKFSAPGRTELAGNHTDHNRGKVLAAAIHLEITADVTQTDDNTVTFRSEHSGETSFPDVRVELSDLSPKTEERGTTAALIRGIAAEFKKRGYRIGGFSANAVSKVLPGSGLSSSAAVEVLLARIFDSLFGDGKLSPLEIARIGQIAENVYFGKPCGLMDQIACASDGAAAIDFKNEQQPAVRQIKFDPASLGYSLCIVNTGGSHADLTDDYASIPAEMKAAAALFGKQVLGELDKETLLSGASDIRKKLGDRALLRSIHFFDENERVEKMISALAETDMAAYLALVNESGASSWQILQNIYSSRNPQAQGISVALALTKDFLKKQKIKGACRVHGGGFAGTIQTYLPIDTINTYRAYIESVFGAGAVTELKIRPQDAIEHKRP
jgi:galactokinase